MPLGTAPAPQSAARAAPAAPPAPGHSRPSPRASTLVPRVRLRTGHLERPQTTVRQVSWTGDLNGAISHHSRVSCGLSLSYRVAWARQPSPTVRSSSCGFIRLAPHTCAVCPCLLPWKRPPMRGLAEPSHASAKDECTSPHCQRARQPAAPHQRLHRHQPIRSRPNPIQVNPLARMASTHLVKVD
jgi:hypothetical protein